MHGASGSVYAPYPDFRDLEGYERDARRASLMGYTGKWAIHPTQIPVANKVYSPTDEEIALAATSPPTATARRRGWVR